MAVKRYLVARYDVTGLMEEEVEVLAGQVEAQAESTDADDFQPGHPDVPVKSWFEDVTDVGEMTREAWDAMRDRKAAAEQ
jgi:hypothetical protein